MKKGCQQYGIHSAYNSIPSNRNKLSSLQRVNSPGLPNTSLRTGCRGITKKLEIGLITDRKLSESPKLKKAKSTENLKVLKRNDSIMESPQLQVQSPQMEYLLQKNFKIIEKLESDKLCLDIYISMQNQNQIMFTGISKENMASEQDKQQILQNLQQLLNLGIERQNQYIRLESLDYDLNQKSLKYQESQSNNLYSSKKRIATQTNDTKSILDRSLSISTIKDSKSNTSSIIKKDIEIIEQRIQKYKMQQNTESKQKQPFGQNNCNNKVKSKISICKSPLFKGTTCSKCKSQRKSIQRLTHKFKFSTKLMHV